MINSLSIARRALLINQKKITTTAHNISNMDTEGYSRQRVIQSTLSPIRTAQNHIGQGSIIERVERVRDTQLDQNYRYQNTKNNYWNTTYDELKQLEDYINDLDISGLSTELNNFWNSWETISENPTNITARTALINNSENLANSFHKINSGIIQKRETLNETIKNDVIRINEITEGLASLNQSVNENSGAGGANNDQLDKFDLLLDELSEYGKVTVRTKDDGSKAVYLGSDQLVSNENFRELKAYAGNSSLNNQVEVYQIVYTDSLKEINLSGQGKIAAIETLRDETLVNFGEKIDNLAVKLTESVNEIHKTGYDMKDPPGNGHDFFDSSVTGAADFDLSSLIKNDPEFIATSQDGEVGDNRISLQISELRTSDEMNGGYTFNEYASNYFSEIASSVNSAKTQSELTLNTKQQVEGYRESIKGVSLDEETANLIEFQRAFQAAAKIVDISDGILQTIINLT